MKPLALFTAAVVVAMFAGCQENAVEPIVAQNTAKPAFTIQTMKIEETIEMNLPDGRVEFAAVAGEITYRLSPVKSAALSKEIPEKQVYDLTLVAKGQLVFGGSAVKEKEGLAKPEMWYFSGNLTSTVQDGANGIEAIFTIDGTKWIAHYHMTFSLNRGVLVEKESLVDFHQSTD